MSAELNRWTDSGGRELLWECKVYGQGGLTGVVEFARQTWLRREPGGNQRLLTSLFNDSTFFSASFPSRLCIFFL